jgi:tetratricopeptide (TPR) repeat protein
MSTGRATDAERFFAAIARHANSPVAALALADYYAIVKRFNDARRLLQDLAGDENSYAPATIRLASIDAIEGNRAVALSRLRELLIKHPKDSSAHLLRARLQLIDRKRDEALAETTAVISTESSSSLLAEAYFLTARIYSAGDRADDAIHAYEEVLKRDPYPLAALLALARLHLTRGALEQAATYGEQALAIGPRNPEAQSLLVRIHLASGSLAKAETELAVLQHAFPNSPTVMDLTAAVQLARNQTAAARASYARSLQFAPADLEALTGLVYLDLTGGRPKDAIALVERRLADAQPSVDVLILGARVYAATADIKQAETLLLRAINGDPDRLQAYSLLGQLYVTENRLEEAKGRFRDVLVRNPKAVAANTMLAILLEQQGHLAEAETEYQRVLGIDPRAAVAANNLAWIYVANNRNLDEALQLAQTAYQRDPEEPNINDTLGWIYYRKNMAGRAVSHLETSARTSPNNAIFQFHLGMAYMQNGNWDDARRALKRAVALQPHFDGIAEATKALASLENNGVTNQ